MREIVPSQLWLGNAMDVRDLRRVHDAGILAIVDLAVEESVPQLSRELIYLRLPITDGAGNSPEVLTAAIEAAASLLRKAVPTLIACSAGMSRTPSIAAAALALVRDEAPDAVLQSLVAGHPHDVSPLLWRDVVAAYNNLAQ